jgi:hypothetical protein
VKTLGEAREAARARANRDGCEWHVYYDNRASYTSERYVVRAAHDGPDYSWQKKVAEAHPGVVVLELSPDEAEEYRRYLETERLTDDSGFEGGMFRTPVQESILTKLLRAMGAVA